jgi:hypothetical protein
MLVGPSIAVLEPRNLSSFGCDQYKCCEIISRTPLNGEFQGYPVVYRPHRTQLTYDNRHILFLWSKYQQILNVAADLNEPIPPDHELAHLVVSLNVSESIVLNAVD